MVIWTAIFGFFWGKGAVYQREDKGARHPNYLSPSKEPEIQEDFFFFLVGAGGGVVSLRKRNFKIFKDFKRCL